jgi:uncharacterized membrane protein
VIADPLAVFVALAALVWLSIWLEAHVKLIRYLGSVLTAILLAAIATNVGLLPPQSETYRVLGSFGVSVGIALVLMGVDVQSVVRAGPRMLGAFGLGVVGTAIGAIVGAFVVHRWVGPETWKLAGQYTGTYTGGSVNFVAVGDAVQTSPDLYSAAIAADNVTTSLWMAACLVLPVALIRWWPQETRDARPANDRVEATLDEVSFNKTKRAVGIADTAAVGALAVTAVWVSEALGARIEGIPSVLWLTTLVLIVAQVPAVKRLAGAPLWGNYVMYLFLATIGAQSVLSEIMRVGPAVFYFTVVVVVIHGLVVFGVGRLLRLDLPTLAVASQANVGGPASAMALAAARGYADRLLPGVAVGLLGYAVGNYTGLAVARLMQGMLAG